MTFWRAERGRLRVGVGAGAGAWADRVSACGVPASPTSSRRNLNLDRKSCQTTNQPNIMKRTAQTTVATMTRAMSPAICHILSGQHGVQAGEELAEAGSEEAQREDEARRVSAHRAAAHRPLC